MAGFLRTVVFKNMKSGGSITAASRMSRVLLVLLYTTFI